MATFDYVVLPHQKKKDGTINAKIRIIHNRQTRYIKTNMYLTSKQLNGAGDQIKDISIKRKLDTAIDGYREIVNDIPALESWTVDDVIGLLTSSVKKKQSSNAIDFLAFIKKRVEEIKERNGEDNKTAIGYNTVLNSLRDFFKQDKVPITDITGRNLKLYEEYLRTERKVMRQGRKGILKEVTLKPMGNGINNYLRDIRALFNDVLELYNDEDLEQLVVKHYPFKKYKIPKPKKPQKRNVDLDVLKKIIAYQPKEGAELEILGQDAFILSFYLVGINLKDLFKLNTIKDGRAIYNRSKTKDRRDDEAFISIKIEPEANTLIDKYKDASGRRIFDFYLRYKRYENFLRAVNNGLKQVSVALELEKKVTSGTPRSTWASIARNNCGISKDDVDIALNHVDPRHKLADVYIERDFNGIDKSNRKVLDIVNHNLTNQ